MPSVDSKQLMTIIGAQLGLESNYDLNSLQS